MATKINMIENSFCNTIGLTVRDTLEPIVPPINEPTERMKPI
jgi:hypothetical protein